MELNDAVGTLVGVGSTKEKALGRLAVTSILDLLNHFPRDYEDRSLLESLRDTQDGDAICIDALVVEEFRTTLVRGGMKLTKGKVAIASSVLDVTYFNQPYVAQALQYGESYIFYGKVQRIGRRYQLTNPYFEVNGKREFVDSIVPIYALTRGVSQLFLSRLIRQSLDTIPKQRESLPAYLLDKYDLIALDDAYQNIHMPATWEELKKAKYRLVFEELLCFSLGLSQLKKTRRQTGATVYQKVSVTAFIENLPFALTATQEKAIEDIRRDVQKNAPMNRLLQGDVGSGKTVVATAGIYLAWQNGLQSAFMAPTDILARQHFKTMQNMLKDFDVRIGLITASLTAKEKREVKAKVQNGEVDLLVGTHAILSDGVQFANLAFVVADEQHRFGVQQRAKLSEKAGKGRRPHVLVMSATPIPRTLALIIYGDLELSILHERPAGRKDVKTYLIAEDKRARLNGFIEQQVEAGFGVYIVCPMVDESDTQEMKSVLQYGAHLQEKVFPKRKLDILHGKLKAKEKERVMQAFMDGEVDILVSTTVIEVGVDVAHASLIVIENADRFGLSQLHQLRGRVGRGPQQSYCILISESKAKSSRERLQALVNSNDGFRLAEEDLKQRGPGDFFGARQHGLPSLKVADLVSDMQVLEKTKLAVADILAQDPALEDAKHSYLMQKTQALFEQYGDSFN